MSGNRLLKAAEEVLSVLEAAGIPACPIGALAVHRWGEARATRDVDISFLAPYGEETQVLDLLRFVNSSRGAPRLVHSRSITVYYC